MYETITRLSQSINHKITNEILGQGDTRFFTEVHLLIGKLVLVVAIHSLRGSCANWHHMPNPQSGTAQPTQDEDHTSHEQSTRVPFGSSSGKGQEPITITTIGVGDNHHPPLDDPRCSKPSSTCIHDWGSYHLQNREVAQHILLHWCSHWEMHS